MKPIKLIESCRYAMDMGIGGDVWRIHGKVNGEWVCPASPIKIDEENDQFETTNSIYKIQDYDQPKKEFWDQIKKDVENKGFEVH